MLIVFLISLGGRLDATNIVSPVLSIITSIQLDHQNILGNYITCIYTLHRDHINTCSTALGNTIDEIALEKAGIMKSGVEVLVGPGCPTDLMKVGG